MNTQKEIILAMIDLVKNEGECIKGIHSSSTVFKCYECPARQKGELCKSDSAFTGAKEFVSQLTEEEIVEALL